jgi:hypothetical protein
MFRKLIIGSAVALTLFAPVAAHAQQSAPPGTPKKSCTVGRTTVDHGGSITGTAIGRGGKKIKVRFACNDGKIVVIG